jgi:hypothetical protein
VVVAENCTVFTWGAQAQGRQVLKCPPLPIPEAATQEHERTHGYMLRITQRNRERDTSKVHRHYFPRTVTLVYPRKHWCALDPTTHNHAHTGAIVAAIASCNGPFDADFMPREQDISMSNTQVLTSTVLGLEQNSHPSASCRSAQWYPRPRAYTLLRSAREGLG